MDRPNPFDPATVPTPCYATATEDYLAVAVAAAHDGALPDWTRPDTMNALRYEGLAVPADDRGPARLTAAGFDKLRVWRERSGTVERGARRGGPLTSPEE